MGQRHAKTVANTVTTTVAKTVAENCHRRGAGKLGTKTGAKKKDAPSRAKPSTLFAPIFASSFLATQTDHFPDHLR